MGVGLCRQLQPRLQGCHPLGWWHGLSAMFGLRISGMLFGDAEPCGSFVKLLRVVDCVWTRELLLRWSHEDTRVPDAAPPWEASCSPLGTAAVSLSPACSRLFLTLEHLNRGF